MTFPTYFSNFPKKNSRSFKLYFDNGYINFDSYYNNNYIFYKKRKLKYNLKPKKTLKYLKTTFEVLRKLF